jgi:hypothetical protein
MRVKLVILAAGFLAVGRLGLAQTPQPAQAPKPAQPTSLLGGGTVDVGGRFTTTDGDEARYERYRDDRDGVYSSFTTGRRTDAYWFDAEASHIGYRDQRYAVDFLNRRVNFSFRWDSVPLNFSYIALTPFQTSGSTLTLDDAAQRAVQGPTNAANDGTAVGVPCAPGAPPASCSNPTQAGQAKANRSTYNNLAAPFDLRQQRDTAAFGLTYAASKSVGDEGWRAAVGCVVRLQHRRRAAAPARQPHKRSLSRRVVDEPQGDVPDRLGRLVVQQPVREPRLGQSDSNHRL